MKKKIVPKNRETVREASDIIINTESDEAAVEFLRDTLKDDYPDLDLGKMDLHEAIKVLEQPKEKSKSGDRTAIENLNKALGDFIDKQEINISKAKSKRKTKRTRKTKKTSKKKR